MVDKFNASMFWYCERNSKNGFTVSKMLCPDDQLFDPVKKLCVFIDATRKVRNSSFQVENKLKKKLTNSNKNSPKDAKLLTDHWVPP